MALLSYWEEEAFCQADIAIVGGGMVGLSLAAEILERRPFLRLVVLERSPIPAGASTRNAGFLCLGSPSELCRVLREVGETNLIELVAQRAAGLRRLLKRFKEDSIGYEPAGGYELILEPYSWVLHELDKLNELLREVVKPPYAVLGDSQLPAFRFGAEAKHLIYLPNEGMVHSGLLMRRMWQYVSQLGGLVMTGATVENWEEEREGVRLRVRDTLGRCWKVCARAAALCTNALAPHLASQSHIRPGRGQLLLTAPIQGLPWRGAFHFEEGYFYFRSVGERVLFGGGRHYDFAGETTTEFAVTDGIQEVLESYLRRLIVPWHPVQVERRWAGIMGFREPALPLISREGERVLFVFACNGMGVALSTHTAERAAQTLLCQFDT